MSETTPTSGRIRRRASRQAGPVDEHDTTGAATAQAAAPMTVVRSDCGPAAGAPAPASTGAGSVGRTADAPTGTDVPDSAGFLRSMRPKEWIAATVAVISLVVLVGEGGFNFYHQRHVDTLAAQRAEYVQTAKQAVLNLTTIKDDTAKQDIDRVLSVASGDLKAEYSQRKDAYAQVVQQAKVKATGAVIEAALESQNADSAQVLVAAKQTLTNAADQQPQDRYYRFRVTVNRGDDGVTASKVEFVA